MTTTEIVCDNRMPPAGSRILIAMSGGVDSVAVAALLTRSGYECMGATLRMTPEHESKPVFEPCCGLQAAEDARRSCEILGIEHRAVRVIEEFDTNIIAPFARQYAAGRTPNPCIQCNRIIKFGLLFRYAAQWGYDYVAMGHYARMNEREGRMALHRSSYRDKDQTYVLAPLTQAQLRRSCFPLGGMTKDEARTIAAAVDPVVGAKAESQEICFVADRNYAGIVEAREGIGTPGNFVDISGKILGRHKGIHRYTIGQRRGLGIGAAAPLYIIRIEASTHTIIVGSDQYARCGSFNTRTLFWGALAPQQKPFQAFVQLHYRHAPVPASITPAVGSAHVVLEIPQRAVAPGQWAVFYDAAGYVLAAGEIQDFSSEIL
ncbi:MAG: tRNA 2-thiouridine(34) synthase MnmA [Candidatus Hydrogenedentes bacterium]|nr:tRNA 2-thiouridine(34) synthase MnmA [Candidatus Hydrogenedentota bacterium]